MSTILRRKPPKQRSTVRFDEIKSDPRKVLAAARRKGGVQLVDERGAEVCRLVLFSTQLAE